MEFVLILAAIVGVIYYFNKSKKAKQQAWENDLEATVPGLKDAAYKHIDCSSKTGIAINTQSRTVSLIGKSKVKNYPFNDIRSWEFNFERAGIARSGGVQAGLDNYHRIKAAEKNSGLFLNVRDIDNPVWQIMFPSSTKDILQKWMEILQQTLNENRA